MQYTVPKFIERKPKIVGPLTFKQFVFIGGAGGICFFLYFFLGKKITPFFVLIAIILMGGSLALAFLKIKGYSLPTFVKNSLMFFLSTKIFIWKRKFLPPKMEKVKKVEKEVEEESSLKIAGRSRLQKLSTQLETKTK
ncbi:PrgI family protein [Patescibacteria group bacterium]|nr:PrgI family protein [Patescibacteria group bacterium]